MPPACEWRNSLGCRQAPSAGASANSLCLQTEPRGRLWGITSGARRGGGLGPGGAQCHTLVCPCACETGSYRLCQALASHAIGAAAGGQRLRGRRSRWGAGGSGAAASASLGCHGCRYPAHAAFVGLTRFLKARWAHRRGNSRRTEPTQNGWPRRGLCARPTCRIKLLEATTRCWRPVTRLQARCCHRGAAIAPTPLTRSLCATIAALRASRRTGYAARRRADSSFGSN